MWHVYDIIGKGSQNNDFVQNKTVISYKNSASERNESLLSKCRAQPVLFKNSASERNESLLSNCRTQPVLFKNSASERNESLLSNCRTQPVLFKNSASERNESLLSNCRAQPVLCKKSFFLSRRKSFFSLWENIVRTDMTNHARTSGLVCRLI